MILRPCSWVEIPFSFTDASKRKIDMPKFSERSLERLNTCHPDLVKVMKAAIEKVDFTVLCGHRGKIEQDIAFREGNSKLKFPQSKHNKTPSLAVDIAPYPIDWNDIQRFKDLAVVILDIAREEGVKLRWGGDWDNNPLTKNNFNDFPHYELVNI
jgi:peptidoglycan L-alanyl-D-glutamate endopeptidase CwlK